MTDEALKQQILKKIDKLDRQDLEEVWGLLTNYLNQTEPEKDWESLSKAQKNGIEGGIRELDEGKGIPHQEVMKTLRKKYNA